MGLKELMVGDWVGYGDRFAIVKSISDNECVILVSVNGQDELVSETYDNIEPVPVTSDILKKNGIEFDERLSCYTSGDKRIILDDREEFMNTENKWYIHADTIDLCSIGSCEITYVHEMQHFLRLCDYQLDIII